MPRRRRQQPEEPKTPPGGWRILSPDDPDAWPLAMVFDLDYTLWDLWIDTHIRPPLKRNDQEINRLVDRRGTELAFYPQVPGILKELKERKILVGAASRTSAPELAREALAMLLVPGPDGETVRGATFFNNTEIYPGSKLRHFKEIHRKTGIPYEQMLFFDDEHRNYEVEDLGVTMQFVQSGVDRKTFEAGLALWRQRRGIRVQEADEKRSV